MVGMSRFVLAAAAVASFAAASDIEVNDQIPFGLAPFLSEGEGASPLDRIAEMEAQIELLFGVLPKADGSSKLDTENARYALQRHFLESRGWRVEALGGLHSQVAVKNGLPLKSSPGRLADILEKSFKGTEFGLKELATLAAAVEQAVQMDSAELLSTAMAVYDVSGQDVDEESRDLVIQTFMLFYLLPDTDYSKQTPESIRKYLDLAERAYPGWTQTMQWVQGLKQTMSEDTTLQALVERIVFGYRHIYDNQCGGLRSLLLKLEQPGTGRVLLSSLRSISPASHIPNSIWQFSESDDELRSMGALDESDPDRMTMIIPNYITADANCLPSSQLVSTCCLSECDALISELEGQFGSHSVSPEQLSDWTRALAPDVSEATLAQLGDVAYSHGGSVPIHGRAFALWLHSAFPAQCPYQPDTRNWVAKAATAIQARFPGARWALRSLALLVAVASGVAGLAKSVRAQKKDDDKDKKVN